MQQRTPPGVGWRFILLPVVSGLIHADFSQSESSSNSKFVHHFPVGFLCEPLAGGFISGELVCEPLAGCFISGAVVHTGKPNCELTCYDS